MVFQYCPAPSKTACLLILPYRFTSDLENIEQEDRAEPLHAQILQDISSCKVVMLFLFFLFLLNQVLDGMSTTF